MVGSLGSGYAPHPAIIAVQKWVRPRRGQSPIDRSFVSSACAISVILLAATVASASSGSHLIALTHNAAILSAPTNCRQLPPSNHSSAPRLACRCHNECAEYLRRLSANCIDCPTPVKNPAKMAVRLYTWISEDFLQRIRHRFCSPEPTSHD